MLLPALLLACTAPVTETDPCAVGEGAGAPSTCSAPTQSDEFYVEASLAYFDTLETGASADDGPAYADGVARWEWPPWLELTGYGRDQMETVDAIIRLIPTAVPTRECHAFDVQPFGRCRVEFVYEDYGTQTCPIYEEFTFNDAGEMTFIEAWADQPAYTPTTDDDLWGEGEGVPRLSTRIPGLGSPTGALDLDAPWMADAAAADPDVADFVAAARDFYDSWLAAYKASGDDVFAAGCGW